MYMNACHTNSNSYAMALERLCSCILGVKRNGFFILNQKLPRDSEE